jgi:hypothetical protein
MFKDKLSCKALGRVAINVCLFGAFSVLAVAQGTGDVSSYAPIKPEASATSYEGKSLPPDNRTIGMISFISSEVGGSIGSSDSNAMRILLFDTQPGERITFNMKSASSKVAMAVYADPTAKKLKPAFKSANMPLHSFRTKKLVFTNTSKEPYEMSLVLYGLPGYEYTLSWERKLKK